MAEYAITQLQSVALNQAAVFTTVNPCFFASTEFFENGTGNFLLRGVVPNPFRPVAVYRVSFNGNIALPEGATVVPIAVGITVDGEVRPGSIAIVTPAAAEEFWNVSSSARIIVPRGSSLSVSLRNVTPPNLDPADTPAPIIDIQNGSLRIVREY